MKRVYGDSRMLTYTFWAIDRFEYDLVQIEMREKWREDNEHDCNAVWLDHKKRELPNTSKEHSICLIATRAINILKVCYSSNILGDIVARGLLCTNNGCMGIGSKMCSDCDSCLCLPCSDMSNPKSVCKNCHCKPIKEEDDSEIRTPFMMFKGGPLIIGQIFIKNGMIGIHPH